MRIPTVTALFVAAVAALAPGAGATAQSPSAGPSASFAGSSSPLPASSSPATPTIEWQRVDLPKAEGAIVTEMAVAADGTAVILDAGMTGMRTWASKDGVTWKSVSVRGADEPGGFEHVLALPGGGFVMYGRGDGVVRLSKDGFAW